MRKIYLFFILLVIAKGLIAQPDRWQQRIAYNINVRMDVPLNRFSGTEKIDYWNNSPDTLTRIFFHTYWNAFQPNSMMDVRSRELGKTYLGKNRRGEDQYDWDARVKDRISKLNENEIGWQHVSSVRINGKEQKLIPHETILEVTLDKPVLPKSKISLDISFDAQVPLQVRRSGRDNAEGIRYSMSQWYPKMVEYDYQGWNANPYIAREFYGVWGDYDVTINIDKSYMVAATGVLQNANEIGYGYESPGVKIKPPAGNTISWHFTGSNIHDFVWAADPQYRHLSVKAKNGVVLNAFYKIKDASADSAWNNVLWAAERVLPYMEKRFGPYPYPQYSFIQGGDGGMEYAMATLIKGPSLGTVIHEWMHSWYQHMLGTNESLFPWMDEGFTTYAEGEITSFYNQNYATQSPYIPTSTKTFLEKQLANDKTNLPAHQKGSYDGYFDLVKSGREEPMSTHADHYNTNYAYSNAAYSKGAVFLSQLGYIVGDEVRDKILLEYYRQWRFKHPNANDFIRVAEKLSGIELQWYKEYWVNSIKTIDYAIGGVDESTGKAIVSLKRLGNMPMPVDVLVTYKDGTKEMHYIPMNLMYGAKPAEFGINRIVETEWKWTHPDYQFSLTKGVKDIKEIEIDPSQRMADVNRINNKISVPQ
ncbi:MAG: family metallopeptidase [Chitinophagaceae bacterium]|nr:family metallopeptidase [Chitinophagaceae bacterium]